MTAAGIDFTYKPVNDSVSGWYHTFTDESNRYVFQFHSDYYDEEEGWRLVQEAMQAADDEKRKTS